MINFKAISKDKKVFSVCGGILVIALIISLSLMLCSNKVALKFNSVLETSPSKMKVLNSNAKKSSISENSYAMYAFTPLQKNEFKKVCEEYGNAALIIRFQINPNEKQKELISAGLDLTFKTGFLDGNDFNKKGKYTGGDAPDKDKITVSGNLKRIWKKFSNDNQCYFDVSFGTGKQGDFVIPEGFFVYSSIGMNIVSVCAAPAELGYDYTGSIPFFGFSTNGGIIDVEAASLDFTGAASIFPVKNTINTEMPSVVVKLSKAEDKISDLNNFVNGRINFGGEKLLIRNVKNTDSLTIPTASFKNPFALVSITDENKIFDSVIMKGGKAPAADSKGDNSGVALTAVYNPIETDPGLILDYNMNNWRCRDYELFAWDRYPGILFFDIRDFNVQNKFFSRLAFYVEKEGYKGTIVTNEFLEGKHGYNAHDYSAESLTSFFNKCKEIGFTLNKEEEILKKILIYNGLILEDEVSGKYVAGKGGLVSISRESPGWSRTRLLAHEGWHTLFFRNEDFRNFVSAVYYTMDSQALQFIKDYFASQPSLGYDQSDEYLMHNEFMAYIMQQPLNAVAENFISYANWNTVTKYAPVTSKYIRETKAQSIEDAAIMLNDYVFDEYGVICGSISLVTKY